MIAGRISKVGNTFALSMQMYDSAAGQLLSGEDVKSKSEDELLDLSAAAAERLLAPLARKARQSVAPGQEQAIAEQGAPLESAGTEEVLLKLETEPPGAVAQLDGRLLCQATPCTKLVAVGAHDLSLQKEGYDDLTESLAVKGKGEVNRKLARIAATLAVETDPASLTVSIDGEKAGTSPLPRRDLAPSAHEVVIDDPCWLKVGERVVLKKGEDRSLHLVGKPRVAVLKLTAEDEQGNAVEARASLDGKALGDAPGTYTVSICAKKVAVRAGDRGAEQDLKLIEGKASSVRLKLAQLGPRPGGSFLESKSGLLFVSIPAGTFQYQGKRRVSVSAFRLGETAVTVAAYKRCVDAGGCAEPNTGGACNWGTDRTDHPINCVDWKQATAFCHWIGGRLPTEEEREYVAAAGSEARTYPWGNEEPGARACWDGEGNDLGKGDRKTTCPVGSHEAGDSKWGLHDLAGNVWEWTSSDYDASNKSIRGGSWFYGGAGYLRARSRYRYVPSGWNYIVGFRCGL